MCTKIGIFLQNDIFIQKKAQRKAKGQWRNCAAAKKEISHQSECGICTQPLPLSCPGSGVVRNGGKAGKEATAVLQGKSST
jgi:hypothetical protein